MRDLPIGVFDSGVGGLTVLGALQRQLPAEDFLYLGDTARLPYGTKTHDTVERYALQAVAALVQRGVKAVVVACNTASAAALPALAVAFPHLPLLGVIEPGAAAAVAASRTGRIAVIGTEGTVRGEAYQQAIHRLNPVASVTAVAATLFVALAEEGWVSGPIAESIARRYLGPLFEAAAAGPDVLVLGCTHFPPLTAAIRNIIGADVAIVDSAATTAAALAAMMDLDNSRMGSESGRSSGRSSGGVHFLVTDGVERFLRTGPGFLGQAIDLRDVERIDLAPTVNMAVQAALS
jgi:glutamate racemase